MTPPPVDNLKLPRAFTELGGCPFHGRVERDEIPTRESPHKQSGTLPSTPLPSTPSPPLCLPAAVHLNAHRV